MIDKEIATVYVVNGNTRRRFLTVKGAARFYVSYMIKKKYGACTCEAGTGYTCDYHYALGRNMDSFDRYTSMVISKFKRQQKEQHG